MGSRMAVETHITRSGVRRYEMRSESHVLRERWFMLAYSRVWRDVSPAR